MYFDVTFIVIRIKFKSLNYFIFPLIINTVLTNFVLNFSPENDRSNEETASMEAMPYIDAFKSGESVEYCISKYNKCSLSLVDMFTKLNDI